MGVQVPSSALWGDMKKISQVIEIQMGEFEDEIKKESQNFELKGFRQGKVPIEVVCIHRTRTVIDRIFGRKIYEAIYDISEKNNLTKRVLEVLFSSEISNYTFDTKESKWTTKITVNLPQEDSEDPERISEDGQDPEDISEDT